MIGAAVWLLAIVAAGLALVLAIELIAALIPLRRPAAKATPRIAIIVPAHDEATGIAATVAALRASAPHDARLIVVADNCGDDTAERAGAAGAEVTKRDEPHRRGKGFALAHARDLLAAAPPDVVLVVDADCTIAGDGLPRLGAAAQASGRPVQSAYLLRPRPDLGAIVGLSGFAFLIRNLVRQNGLARLGAPALLTGSGMAFPWPVFAEAPLADAALAEDLALGIALSRAGTPPSFLPDVITWSDPVRRTATRVQRTRWEQGSLRTALSQAPSLLGSGRWPLVWLGMHLLVPPLALLVLIDVAVLILLILAGANAPAALLGSVFAVAVVLLLVHWARSGRAQISGVRLLLVPFYVAWKLPIYLGALLRPERRWVRTERD